MSDTSAKRKPNRLIRETSPYLRQHAHNPVDWHPWGDEAFEKAKREDKPVFLSIGYSTCHWCHVMERESFEDDEIARVLNEHFIPIKVDREERPDLDEIYMSATQLMAGRGGWPNSVWLTPDGRPWYAGTYFPPKPAGGIIGFGQLLETLARAWRERRDEVERQAAQMTETIRQVSLFPSAKDSSGGDSLALALRNLESRFDPEHGGFDGAPKFPPHSALMLLEDAWERGATETQRRMLTETLDAMARGGVHDHVGGGFHRYCTDARWFLPHFEKMLYDNALLLRAYAEGFRLTGKPEYKSVAMRIAEWAAREMLSPEGGFYSALDADSEGIEGRFYVWTRSEIMEHLGPHDGEFFCRIYGVEEGGNFLDEASGRTSAANVLYLRAPLDGLFNMMEVSAEDGLELLEELRGKMLALRERRPRPHRDEKVLASWNGLMIGALACAGKAFEAQELTALSARAAECVLAKLQRDGKLLHSYCEGEARISAYLDDYAYLGAGLLELHDATGDTRWLKEARRLAGQLCERFSDPEAGGFFLAPADGEALLARTKPAYDQPLPSGNGVATQLFIRLGRLTGSDDWLERAEATVKAFRPVMHAAPHGTHTLIIAESMLEESRRGAGPRGLESPVSVHVGEKKITAKPGGTALVSLQVSIAEGYHVADGAAAIGIALSENEVAEVAEIGLPKPERLKLGAETVSAYKGTLNIKVVLQVREDAPEGEHRLSLEVKAQPCTERECRPPLRVMVPIALRVVP
jgi:hypothetical protein